MGIKRPACTGDFGQDRCASPLGMFIALQHKQTRPFTIDETVAIQVEWTTSLGWVKFGQKRRGDRYIASDFTVQPDFRAIAAASGCFGQRVETPEEIKPALEGAMEVTLKDYTDVLYPGDSIYYDSTVPHLVRCHGDKRTVILAVLYTAD